MKTSSTGRKFTETYEGLRLKSYKDATGTWTIGYGHTSAAGLPKVVAGQTITQAEADSILSNDLIGFEKDVANLVKVPLNQNQYDALISFQYNTGALGKSSALKALNKGDYEGAANKLTLYNVSKGKVLPGLTKRREAEKALFLKPVNNNVEHGTAGGVIAGTAVALTQTPHHYWPWIIVGGIVATVIAWFVVNIIRKG